MIAVHVRPVITVQPTVLTNHNNAVSVTTPRPEHPYVPYAAPGTIVCRTQLVTYRWARSLSVQRVCTVRKGSRINRSQPSICAWRDIIVCKETR